MLRPPVLGDVICAARALLAVPPEARAERLICLMDEAAKAARHVEAIGRGHPRLGDGSLMAAALSGAVVKEPSLSDRDYCRCLAMVLEALSETGPPEDADWTPRVAGGSASGRADGMSPPLCSR